MDGIVIQNDIYQMVKLLKSLVLSKLFLPGMNSELLIPREVKGLIFTGLVFSSWLWALMAKMRWPTLP